MGGCMDAWIKKRWLEGERDELDRKKGCIKRKIDGRKER